jgi:hypothetical protein
MTGTVWKYLNGGTFQVKSASTEDTSTTPWILIFMAIVYLGMSIMLLYYLNGKYAAIRRCRLASSSESKDKNSLNT